MATQSVISIYRTIWQVLAPEKRFCIAVMIYGAAISLLALAVPVSVQALISSVTNTLLLRPVVVLAIILLVLLTISSVIYAMQIYVMEMMERRLYARLTRDIALKLLYADSEHLDTVNRTALSTRFFEIMHIQKIVPSLLIRGFAVLLQIVVGMILVSFYHPYLLFMNLLILGVLYAFWQFGKHRGIREMLEISKNKYDTARILGEFGRANPLFRSFRNRSMACNTANNAVERYLSHRRKFFRVYFLQHVGFLGIYVLGSACLLGVGGYLVIKEQLTIGQLVAAELIMSAIFYGITRLGFHLLDLYELTASCRKLDDCLSLPQEPAGARQEYTRSNTSLPLEFRNVRIENRQAKVELNLAIPAGTKVLAHSSNQSLEALVFKLLRKQRNDYTGEIFLGDYYLSDIDQSRLLDDVYIIDNHYIMECTIAEWLQLGCENATHSQMMNVLKQVELDAVIHALPQGLDTPLQPSGYPLQFSELIRLKLAAAMLARPAVLIINGLFDILNTAKRERIMHEIFALPLTFIYCTNSRCINGFDYYLSIRESQQTMYEDATNFEEAIT